MTQKKLLIDIKMIEMGLAPESSSGRKLQKLLDSLSEEDNRIARRKFRKQWKKLVKSEPELANALGFGSKKPTTTHMRNRRAFVRRRIYQKISDE